MVICMNRIHELREQMGISMREAAKRLRMPYTTYVNYEKGLREPSSEILILLARFFNVTIDYLVGNVNDPQFYLDNKRILEEINNYEEPKKAPTEDGERSENSDILDEVDVAFYGDYKQLTEENKETLRAMARLFRERQGKQE